MRNNYKGQEISVGAIQPLLDALAPHNIDPHLLPDPVLLKQKGARISWTQFVSLLELAGAKYSESQLKALGARALTSTYYRSRLRFARLLLTLEDGYRLMVYPHRVVDFGCTQAAVDAKPGHVKVTAILIEGYEASETFFTMLSGAMQALPTLFGHHDGEFHGEVKGRYMHFSMRFSPTRSRVKRWLSTKLRVAYCASNTAHADNQLVSRTFALEAALMERDIAIEALRKDRINQQRRMENSSEVIAEYDELNQLVYLSPNGERIFGYPNNVLLANPFQILLPKDQAAAEAFFANPTILPSGIYPMQGLHADGHELALEVAISHFLGHNGKPRWNATFRDVSNRALSSPEPLHQQLRSAAGSKAQDPPRQSAAALQQGKTILIADDDEVARRIGSNILTQAGYRVVCVGDGQSVISQLQQQALAAVLLDVNMPGLSGIEVYEQLQLSADVPPIVFVSGEPERVKSHDPSLSVISKPFRADQLVSAVARAMAA